MEYFQQLSTVQQNALLAANELAEACHQDPRHIRTTIRYAFNLFDSLYPLHGYGEQEKVWLYMGTLLHDIGWVEGKENHHKASLNIILKSPLLPLDNKERLIVGAIARYHRKALPSLDHDHFSALEFNERQMVITLASFLRLADGIDHLGKNNIRNLEIEVTPQKVIITCKLITPPHTKDDYTEKADLFEIAFKRKLKIKWTALFDQQRAAH
jgi:exopolyphosphatase/pppGpp-phosphohydrolase